MLSQEGRIVIKNYRKDGMNQTAIAKKLGVSRRTVYRYGRNGKEEAMYGPRRPQPSKLDRFKPYLRGRLRHFPDLTARRLLHHCHLVNIRGNSYRLRGYAGLEMPEDPPPSTIRKRGRPPGSHHEEGVH